MKPEGNMVGNCTGLNEEPQRLIGYKDKAKAESNNFLIIKAIPNLLQSFPYRYLEFLRHESGKR